MAVERVPPDPVANPSGTSSSSNINRGPRGRLARDTLTSNGTGTICTATVSDLPADRTLDIEVKVVCRSDIAGGIKVAILEDGTQIDRANIEAAVAGVDNLVAFSVETQPLAGAHSWDLVVDASGGAGNVVTAVANGATGTRGNSHITVTDVGDSYP